MSDLISIIVPCYNEEPSLPFFYKEICRVFSSMEQKYSVNFELLFVNDGSRDATLSLIKEYAGKDSRVKYISFSRNFGKEGAIFAGLEHARGDYIAMMDADLQDPPALLSEMYTLIKNEDYDCIGTRRVDRKGEPPIRSFFAHCFYCFEFFFIFAYKPLFFCPLFPAFALYVRFKLFESHFFALFGNHS